MLLTYLCFLFLCLFTPDQYGLSSYFSLFLLQLNVLLFLFYTPNSISISSLQLFFFFSFFFCLFILSFHLSFFLPIPPLLCWLFFLFLFISVIEFHFKVFVLIHRQVSAILRSWRKVQEHLREFDTEDFIFAIENNLFVIEAKLKDLYMSMNNNTFFYWFI